MHASPSFAGSVKFPANVAPAGSTSVSPGAAASSATCRSSSVPSSVTAPLPAGHSSSPHVRELGPPVPALPPLLVPDDPPLLAPDDPPLLVPPLLVPLPPLPLLPPLALPATPAEP